ncbi:MAG: sensor domain-containing diguanylate cyclase [Deltaproteobacteria bacterium]|nr:sensor domain-containing diguanylate cyclase [Deltaproteobacteria bacterium]
MSNPADDFRCLLNATKIISSSLSLEEQLPALMDAVVQLTGAERAMLILRAQDGSFAVKAERSTRSGAERSGKKYSQSTIEKVFLTGEPLFILANDLHRQAPTESMEALQLRTVMCTPLASPAGIIGVIYAHSSTPVQAFDAHKKEIFVALSEHAAVALNNARLFEASVSDPMTGLHNHAYCLRRLKEEVERAQRYARPLSFLLFDVDDFKTINDTHGHRRGDEVIRAVAGALQSSVRNVDVAARYGGDELALILPETKDTDGTAALSGAKLLAERIRAKVAALDVPPVAQITVSVGVAALSQELGADELVDHADQALYASKRAGKNRVTVFGEI